MGVESLALLVMLVAVAVAARAPFEEEGPGSDMELERMRRIPYYFPASFQRGLYWGPRGGYGAKRAMPPVAELDEDDDEEMDNEDPMIRRRRIPYYFPRNWNGYPRGEDKRMARRKRVSPYFYPNMRALRFLGQDVGYANPWKRMMPMRKRDLLETLANDDPSAFGYDKRKRFIDIEDDQDEDEDDSDGFEEEKRKRKKKSA